MWSVKQWICVLIVANSIHDACLSFLEQNGWIYKGFIGRPPQ